MNVRRPVVANAFYEGDAARCERAIENCLRDYTPPEGLGRVMGGVVPHAGWVFSGATAGKVFLTLQKYAGPETVVLFGAVHRWGGSRPVVDGHDAWATPLGDVPVDHELGDAVMSAGDGGLARDTAAHAEEHSIEVQVPFIRKLLPDARILPIAVPPAPGAAEAGTAVARAVAASGRSAVVVASTDLTHYGMSYYGPAHGPLPGALPWVKDNDRRFIRLVEKLDAEAIVPEAQANHNACGAGAVAAAVRAAAEMGASEARLLEYTTSYDVMGGRGADSAVGYAGLVFRADE